LAIVHESKHPLVKHKLTLLRDSQTEPKRFRELIREISMLLIYEATKDLETREVTVRTPMGVATCRKLAERIGLVPVLRAGLGMVEGIEGMMPGAEIWHIGLYRDHRTLQPVEYYNRLPIEPTVQVCLILDPMLATGNSAAATVDLLKRWGAGKIKYIGIIASRQGIKTLTETHPDVSIYVAEIDEELTPEPQELGDPPAGYIVPGLGDAGDRQFGTG
jgi:uracil phosphoribosyltransferase